MTTTLRTLRLLLLSAWVGSLIFFAFAVAPVAFKVLPDTHTAGLVVRGTLLVLHRIGLFSGALYLLLTLALLALRADGHRARFAELGLVSAMLLVTAYLQISVLPRMESDRLTLGGEVTTASPDAPARRHFERLHTQSEKLEGFVLLAGVATLCLAPLHGTDRAKVNGEATR